MPPIIPIRLISEITILKKHMNRPTKLQARIILKNTVYFLLANSSNYQRYTIQFINTRNSGIYLILIIVFLIVCLRYLQLSFLSLLVTPTFFTLSVSFLQRAFFSLLLSKTLFFLILIRKYYILLNNYNNFHSYKTKSF